MKCVCLVWLKVSNGNFTVCVTTFQTDRSSGKIRRGRGGNAQKQYAKFKQYFFPLLPKSAKTSSKITSPLNVWNAFSINERSPMCCLNASQEGLFENAFETYYNYTKGGSGGPFFLFTLTRLYQKGIYSFPFKIFKETQRYYPPVPSRWFGIPWAS